MGKLRDRRVRQRHEDIDLLADTVERLVGTAQVGEVQPAADPRFRVGI